MSDKNLGRRKALKLLIAGAFGAGAARAAEPPVPAGCDDIKKAFGLPGDINAACFRVRGDRAYVSDAFKKRVFCFGRGGEKIWESSGADRFAIPCGKFPLDISPEGELWVANTGKHRLERLDPKTGEFICEWVPAKGFELRGCCNPMAFACMGNGSFALMEKGAWEFRIFEPSGAAVKTAKIARDWMKYDVQFEGSKGLVKFFDGENIKTFKA